MITLVNPNDRDHTKHTYILALGGYGSTYLMVYANHLEDALDEAIDWIADNAPGLLCDEEVSEAYKANLAAIAESGRDEEDMHEHAWEAATQDTTCGGNNGHYIHSWEWSIVAEDPTREEKQAIISARGGIEVAK